MELKKTFNNIWYYYKWYFAIGAVLLVALAIGINSCVNRKNYDVNVLYVTYGYSDNFYQADELVALFDSYAPDSNADGVNNTQLISINYGTTVQETNSAGAARSANLASGKCLLFLLDEQNYQELKAGGFLDDISALGNSDYLSSDAYKIYESGVLDGVSGFKQLNKPYYLCLRKYDESRAKADKNFAAQYYAAKQLLTNIINEN